MSVTSLVAVVAPHTAKIIKKGYDVFKRGKNFDKMVY